MKTVLINYADCPFLKSQVRNTWTGLTAGRIDLCWSYGAGDLDEAFRRKNKEVLDQDRGAGYWLWKPYIIADALEKAEPGDVLIYCDSGSVFIRSVEPLVRLCCDETPGVLGFVCDTGTERTWTKRDAFILMDCDRAEFHDDKQIETGLLIFVCNEFSRTFVAEWLRFALDPRILSDAENECGKSNMAGFRDHRHDQSIFSLLCKKNGLSGRSHRLANGPIVRPARVDIDRLHDWLRPRPKLRWISRWARPISLRRWRRPNHNPAGAVNVRLDSVKSADQQVGQ
ncbi:MAG: hypothetical protein GY791_06755 [Alphaproteobacteria bacterium]|nr:hypothetical protein [Alphaproteobacteria bacterium]